MKHIKFLLVGILFGIIMYKAQTVSWYRIYEMFRFESFHMYGIICTAIVTGIIGLQIIKKKKVKDFNGYPIMIVEKEKGFYRYIIGGLLFGLGWGLVGSCPGPIFILIGTGALSMIIVLIGAVLGTFLYGIIKDKLPH